MREKRRGGKKDLGRPWKKGEVELSQEKVPGREATEKRSQSLYKSKKRRSAPSPWGPKSVGGGEG